MSDKKYLMTLPDDLKGNWMLATTNSVEHPCPFVLLYFKDGNFNGPSTDKVESCKSNWNDGFNAAIKKARAYPDDQIASR